MKSLKLLCWTGLTLLLSAAALAFPAFAQTQAAHSAATAPAALEIVLLGTAAGPTPRANRSQPSSLLRVDGTTYLIDAGDNVSQQLSRAGGMVTTVEAVFITHMHFDHTLGLGSLMAFGWQNGRARPLPIWGPPGIAEFVAREGSALAISADIFRPQLPPRGQFADLYPVHVIEADAPVEVFRDDKVRVTATRNTHYDSVHREPASYGPDGSYSYRFDTTHGSVVFTGDTGPSENLQKLAERADVLVSEIVDLDSLTVALRRKFGADADIESTIDHMRHDHLTAAEVGRLAQAAHVKKIVLTHFSMGPDFDPAAFVTQIREYYPVGEIVVGSDLGVYGPPTD